MNKNQSKIGKLISELCPNGVEFEELGEVLDYEQPSRYIVNSTEYNDNHKTPVLTAGQSFILGYTNELDGIYNANKENPVIIFDDFTTSFHWVDFDFKVKSSAMKMLRLHRNNKSSVDFRFIYYAMRCIAYKPTDHARHWISQYSKIKIPVPPLSIQEEIVKILDNFVELENELEAELEARKNQYDYYRKYLMLPNNKSEWKTLGDIYDFQYGEGNTIPNTGGIYPVYGGNRLAGQHDQYNSEDAPVIGHIGAYAGIVNWVDGKHFVTYNGVICKIKANINPRYGYYLLLLQDFISQAHAGSQPFVSYDILKKAKVQIPDLSHQNNIVSILDKFDTLLNNTSVGLPAELKARRSQYEYYREKLLTFNEIEK